MAHAVGYLLSPTPRAYFFNGLLLPNTRVQRQTDQLSKKGVTIPEGANWGPSLSVELANPLSPARKF